VSSKPDLLPVDADSIVSTAKTAAAAIEFMPTSKKRLSAARDFVVPEPVGAEHDAPVPEPWPDQTRQRREVVAGATNGLPCVLLWSAILLVWSRLRRRTTCSASTTSEAGDVAKTWLVATSREMRSMSFIQR
jgi:hypothetical protein